MPVPETPNTREEMYLNAMATGDSGGIPPVPYTRQEMYLDAIARNGGGGGGSTGGGVLVLHMDNDTGALDKTWQEIYDGLLDGIVFVLPYNVGSEEEPAIELYIVTTAYLSGDYRVECFVGINRFDFYASTANDYPTLG